ncbi:TetR/AcrR family transcriptional regulator [Arthrobacter sp. GCM10027362]|uniref:TetR/AcrR family transcriptional regulator n=1 Tax=Arthrobacter sp. GCM10027362 TaxID=3273379 RepID=UPI003633CA0F
MTTTEAAHGRAGHPRSQPPRTGADPTASPPSLRMRQQLRTREDLVRAALDVITAEGLEAATIDRITKRAGTSRATLYAHFPGGRADLLAEAYQTLGRDLIGAAEQHAARQADWIDRLCAYPRAMLDLAATRQLGLFYNVSGPQLVGMKRRGIGSQRTLDTIAAELAQARERGDVPSHLDVEAIAALLVGAIREAGIDASRDPATAPRRLAAFRQLLEALSGH